MEVRPDKTHTTDWLSDAACRPALPGVTWHWEEAPPEGDAAPALSVCASCPVVDKCLLDMKVSNERYRFQVRAGILWWL